MIGNWEHKHAELLQYIETNNDIVITDTQTRIPDDLRNGFYKLFDDIRLSLLKENASEELNKAEVLSAQYKHMEQVLQQRYGVEKITMEPDLFRYLQHPASQLIRGLYDPLFDLLKVRLSPVQFEQLAVKTIQEEHDRYYKQGYQKWVSLVLVESLQPDNFLKIPLDELNPKERHVGMNGPLLREVPVPIEADIINFDYEPDPIFSVPDIIVQSKRSGGYYALKTSLRKPLGSATNASSNRKWVNIDSYPSQEHCLILVYTSIAPGDLSLVGDSYRVCSPEIIIQLSLGSSSFFKPVLETFKFSMQLNPSIGVYLIGDIDRWPREILEDNKKIIATSASTNEDDIRKIGVHCLSLTN